MEINQETQFIRLFKNFFEHPVWTEKRKFSKAECWIDILNEVRFAEKEKSFLIGNALITCKQGQSLNSLDTWAKRWGMSKSSVRRLIGLFAKLDMIKTENVEKTTRLTVLKYSQYINKRHVHETHMNQTRNIRDSFSTPEVEGKEGIDGKKEKNKTKKEVLPLTPQGEVQFDSSSKVISINENKKFKSETGDTKSVIDKKIEDLKKKFGVNRVLKAYELFELFLNIGKTKSFHKEIQSIKNICNILKKDLASMDDLKRSIENYKISKSEQIDQGFIFSCANFFGSKDEYTNYTNIVIEEDPMEKVYREMRNNG
ncbi:MAG: hypothetical protein KC646_10135 [Candidatus Cloacimonetes bacterium]|nr:hypothetical protein [Candidatus Cloacimonadota bacterium]